ncbi:MAG: hypothetical protein DWG76_07275 [Chloroflexi bacterium]|nr:hypothetical protein [Chloroflexota bacterium]
MFENFGDIFAGFSGENILNLLIALGILLGGWVVARVVGFLVRRLIQRTRLVERFNGAMDGDSSAQPDVERWAGAIAFWLIMLFVLIAFFQTLQLTAISSPLSDLLNQVLSAGPQLLGAALILLLAWIVASVARMLVSRALGILRLEERLKESADIEAESASVRESLSTGIFWLVFLLFLPAVLSTLGMQGLVGPVQGVVDGALGAIPGIFGAAVLLLVGWVIARIVRQITVNLLGAAGVDRFGERVGIGAEGQSLTQLIGTVVYVLVLIPAVIAAINSLGIEALAAPAVSMLTTVLTGVPAFFGALLVLAVAYYVGKLIAGLVTNVLAGVGLDSVPERLGFSMKPAAGQRTLSEIAGSLALVGVMLLSAAEAASLLGLPTLSVMIANFTTWGGQAIVALMIFAIGLYLANLARDVIVTASGTQANFTANFVRTAILIFVVALALQQLGVASETVNLAFGILLGAIAVATALAFGLGARDVAGKQVEAWMGDLQGSKSASKK